MTFSFDDTIAALASPPGPGARGIVRVSGPDVRALLDRLFEPDDAETWRAARVPTRHAGRFRLSRCRVPLPVAVYLWPGRRSYTGQPAAEVHTVGSPPLLEAMLSDLHDHGARPARPGEFTLRAFLAGRLDLVQAEAVLGVIDAHDHRELELALRQLAGGLSGRIAAVRRELLDLLADLEAGLDFVDEDIEFIGRDELLRRLDSARETLVRLLEQAEARMQTTGRRRVVLAGLPNAGKSSLFNALVGREAALVSEIQGTTRDYLSAELDWDGTAVELIDTAGWEGEEVEGGGWSVEAAIDRLSTLNPQPSTRDPSGEMKGRRFPDAVMQHAQTLRGEQLQQADLVLYCTAADFDSTARAADANLIDDLRAQQRAALVVETKCDLRREGGRAERVKWSKSATLDSSTLPLFDRSTLRPFDSLTLRLFDHVRPLPVSARTGEGLPALIAAASARLSETHAGERQLLGTTASRCRESLAAAAESLQQAGTAAEAHSGEELVALEVRESLEHLGRILGTVYTDDILDRVFSRFCIGK